MQQAILVQEHTLKIVKIIDEAPDVKIFRLEPVNGSGIKFFAGQFFMARFEDNFRLQRAYSVASSPEQKKHIDITMNLAGEFTNKLWRAKIGEHLIFKGPYGKFYFSEEMKDNIVLIGGGLGITPLISIIRMCNDKKLPNKIELIYSTRTPKDIVYRDELEKQRKENANFDYTLTITRAAKEHKWHGRSGRINAALLKEKIKEMEKSLYFICGPLEFVKSTIEILESMGAKKEQIKTDIWG